jgi:hypothetical protein
MWNIFDISVFALPVAVVLWVAMAIVVGAVPGRARLQEGIGWAASLATSVALLSVVPFMLGLFLYLPVLWLGGPGSTVAEVLSWVEALVLTAGVIWLAVRVFRFRRARFLSLMVIVIGLSSVWLGRLLATVDWFPAQS